MSETLMINKCDKKKKQSKFSSGFKKLLKKAHTYFQDILKCQNTWSDI